MFNAQQAISEKHMKSMQQTRPYLQGHAMQHRHLPHHEWTRPLMVIGYFVIIIFFAPLTVTI